MSIEPPAAATSARRWTMSARLPGTAVTPGTPDHSRSSGSTPRASTTSRQPRSTSSRPRARPRPREAPVTIAVGMPPPYARPGPRRHWKLDLGLEAEPPPAASKLSRTRLTRVTISALGSKTGARGRRPLGEQTPSARPRRLANGRLVHRQRPRVRVERARHAERHGCEVLAVPEGEPVQHGHAEAAEPVLEHLLERFHAREARVHLAELRLRELADDDAQDAVELACGSQLHEYPVELPAWNVHVLEEQDRPLRRELPRCAHRLREQPETAADQRRRDTAAGDRAHIRIVERAGHLA